MFTVSYTKKSIDILDRDNGILALSSQCKNLKHVDLQCNRLTDNAIIALCRNCHHIQVFLFWIQGVYFDLRWVLNETEDFVQCLAYWTLGNQSTHWRCIFWTGTLWRKITRIHSSSTLFWNFQTPVHTPLLAFAISRWTFNWNFSFARVMEGLFQMLNRCKALKTLILDIEDIGKVLLRTISCCSSLQKLHISHCTASKQNWDTLATRLTNLTDLYISGKHHSVLYIYTFILVCWRRKQTSLNFQIYHTILWLVFSTHANHWNNSILGPQNSHCPSLSAIEFIMNRLFYVVMILFLNSLKFTATLKMINKWIHNMTKTHCCFIDKQIVGSDTKELLMQHKQSNEFV
jgi:hypothetical protein